ncbi:hypothetical protein [Thermus sp.]|uniref:hypothetical protein n=1 Tax=Thermus sp. TaxID=275 RepID=UPI00321F620F
MDVLGDYWLRRILARIGTLTAYEGQDTRTGMPVLILKGAEGRPLEGEGLLAPLETLPEERAWVLEWPLGAVPMVQYLGVADPERLAHWVEALARVLGHLRREGVEVAPVPELCLVKGRRVWLGGAGLEALSGSPERALAALARALSADWEAFPLKEALEALEKGERRLEDLFPQEAPPPEPLPEEPRKRLPVEPAEEPPPPPPPAPEEGKAPSRPRVIRIQEPEDPSFPVVEPKRPSRGRRGLLWGLLFLALGLGFFLSWPRPSPSQGYVMEFRTDPPTEKAEVVLLEAPEGSRLVPGRVLLTAPGRVEFDQKGIYRLRIRVPGRDPVDYLLEVPGPPLTIKVR